MQRERKGKGRGMEGRETDRRKMEEKKERM